MGEDTLDSLRQEIDDLHAQIYAAEQESDDRASDSYNEGYRDGYDEGYSDGDDSE